MEVIHSNPATLVTFADSASTIKKLSENVGVEFQESDPITSAT
jgi:hypothetical protein